MATFDQMMNQMMKQMMNNMVEASTKPKFRDACGSFELSTCFVIDAGCYESCLFESNGDSEVIARYSNKDSEMIGSFHKIAFHKLKKLSDDTDDFQEVASKLSEFCSTLE